MMIYNQLFWRNLLDLLHYMLVPHYLGTPPHRWIVSLYDSNTQLKDDSSIRSIRSSSCYHAGEFHHGHGFSSQFYPIIGFQFKLKVTGIVMIPEYLTLSEPNSKFIATKIHLLFRPMLKCRAKPAAAPMPDCDSWPSAYAECSQVRKRCKSLSHSEITQIAIRNWSSRSSYL